MKIRKMFHNIDARFTHKCKDTLPNTLAFLSETLAMKARKKFHNIDARFSHLCQNSLPKTLAFLSEIFAMKITKSFTTLMLGLVTNVTIACLKL